MLASCGMNCMVCYKHCCHKGPCAGCLGGGRASRNTAGNRIRDCARRGLTYCHEVPGLSCRQVKALDRSYRTRRGKPDRKQPVRPARRAGGVYGAAEKRYTCPACGGIISSTIPSAANAGWVRSRRRRNKEKARWGPPKLAVSRAATAAVR